MKFTNDSGRTEFFYNGPTAKLVNREIARPYSEIIHYLGATNTKEMTIDGKKYQPDHVLFSEIQGGKKADGSSRNICTIFLACRETPFNGNLNPKPFETADLNEILSDQPMPIKPTAYCPGYSFSDLIAKTLGIERGIRSIKIESGLASPVVVTIQFPITVTDGEKITQAIADQHFYLTQDEPQSDKDED